MTVSAVALQQAVVETLRGDNGLTGVLGGPRVYDDLPPRSAFPYVTIGTSSEADFSSGSDEASEHRLTLIAWSRAKGRKEVVTIVGAIHSILHNAGLALDGHRLVNLRFELSDVRHDGETMRGLMQFRAVTEPLV